MKRFVIKEIFFSVQGEGFHAGKPTVFVRFGACNLWSGKDDTRERDAERNQAVCPKWCDTDFAEGSMMTADNVVEAMMSEVHERLQTIRSVPHVVFTGGEPMLHLTPELVETVRFNFDNACIAVETNGTIRVPQSLGIDWITVSPKTHQKNVVQSTGDELKVVWPGSAHDPETYRNELGSFDHYYVSPLAELQPGVGMSLIDKDNLNQAFAYVMNNPGWKMSLQTHKILGAR